jgi:hypothetical protein
MNEENVTIPLPPALHAAVSRRAEPTTLHDSAKSTAVTSSGLDPRSMLGTLGGLTRLRNGIAFWARLNALICLGMTVLHEVTYRWFAHRTGDAPWASLTLVALLLSTSVAVERLRLGQRALETVDLVATVASGFAYAVLFATSPDVTIDSQELLFELVTAQLLMTRAAVVPSSGARSLHIGCLTLVPGAVLSIMGRVSSEQPWLWATTTSMLSCAASVVASVLASRRIYGLQRQVNEARRVGPYTLVEKVGAGGMGEVFRARHALLRRPTAIKLIRADSASEDSLLQFEREAQLTSQLTHPSTIQIYDFGRTEDGVFYYAMEYIDGLTLHELVALTGPQPPARVIALLVQICGSLAEAHAAGLVHRDIKSANIMLCERGRVADVVKVLDFGLVKRKRPHGNNTLDSKSNLIVGTPGFMAPEAIIEPAAVDARTDIYALGAVGYFLITGHPVFAGASDVALLFDQVSTPPVPMSLRLGTAVPADLDRAIISCLAKDPSLRPQSADALRQCLLACRDAGAWSELQAQAWWAAHRGIVQQRARDRSISVNESVVVEGTDGTGA